MGAAIRAAMSPQRRFRWSSTAVVVGQPAHDPGNHNSRSSGGGRLPREGHLRHTFAAKDTSRRLSGNDARHENARRFCLLGRNQRTDHKHRVKMRPTDETGSGFGSKGTVIIRPRGRDLELRGRADCHIQEPILDRDTLVPVGLEDVWRAESNARYRGKNSLLSRSPPAISFSDSKSSRYDAKGMVW